MDFMSNIISVGFVICIFVLVLLSGVILVELVDGVLHLISKAYHNFRSRHQTKDVPLYDDTETKNISRRQEEEWDLLLANPEYTVRKL